MYRLLNLKSIFPLVTKAKETGAKLPFGWNHFQQSAHSILTVLPII